MMARSSSASNLCCSLLTQHGGVIFSRGGSLPRNLPALARPIPADSSSSPRKDVQRPLTSGQPLAFPQQRVQAFVAGAPSFGQLSRAEECGSDSQQLITASARPDSATVRFDDVGKLCCLVDGVRCHRAHPEQDAEFVRIVLGLYLLECVAADSLICGPIAFRGVYRGDEPIACSRRDQLESPNNERALVISASASSQRPQPPSVKPRNQSMSGLSGENAMALSKFSAVVAS